MKLVRRPSADLHGAQPLFCFEMTTGIVPAQAAGQIREDDDRELKALGLVHRHQPHPVAALFQDRRFRAGKIHTKFVDEEFEFKDAKAQHHEEAAVLAAAIEFFRRERMTPKYASPRPLSTWKMAWREDT